MNRVAAVIVTHQSADVVAAAIESCLASGCEVVVVDNASTDGIVRMTHRYPQARWILNSDNRGFAGGVNQGFRATNASFVLLLNPDAVVGPGLEYLESACTSPEVGAATGRLCDMDGTLQQGFSVRRFPTPAVLILETLGVNKLWPGNPVNRRYRYADLDETKAADVEQPAGAFLLIRRDAWARVGGFDERFHPVWFEDVDFCKRLHEAGFRIRFEPGASARHIGGHSAGKLPLSTKELHWYASLLEYVRKHYSRWQLATVSLAVVLGAVPRMVMGIFRVRNLSPVSTYAKVIRLACRYFFLGDNGVRSRAVINNE